MRRSIVRVLLGIILISHTANLLIFTAAGLSDGSPPLSPAGERTLHPPDADPLPQALVLTAIVIGFARLWLLL